MSAPREFWEQYRENNPDVFDGAPIRDGLLVSDPRFKSKNTVHEAIQAANAKRRWWLDDSLREKAGLEPLRELDQEDDDEWL